MEMNKIIMYACSLFMILIGLIFMIWANAIAKSMGKVKGVIKDLKRKKKVFIGGLVFFIIGIIFLILAMLV